VAPTKSIEPAIQQAIDLLTSQGRDVTTSAILSRLSTVGVKANASDIYASAAWKQLLAKEKGQETAPVAQEPPARTPKPKAASSHQEEPVAQQAKPNFPAKACPQCGTLIHARSQKHETCGWVMAEAAPAPSVNKAKKLGRPKKVHTVANGGGITVADIQAVKKLVDALGADKVLQLATVLGE